MEIGPNLIWRRHTDQLKDCNAPVTDHLSASHPVPSPTTVDNYGDQVAEQSEQSKAVSRETVDQSANSVAEYSVSTPPSQVEHVPVKRYPTMVRKPPARLDLLTLALPIEH